jgi:TolA-binding protein
MKTVALFCCFIITTNLFAQTSVLGKIIYYEGKVELGKENKWTPVKLNNEVSSDQSIKTGASAMAEILWNSGSKTVVGANSTANISDLHKSSSSKVKAETEGVFTGFKAKANTRAVAKRTEEGGIRRDLVETDTTTASEEVVYWKEDREISFEEAYAFYENKEYTKAISALHAFLMQKPKNEMAPIAMFALGHAYIMSNNNIKAKEIFSNFVSLYPNDALRADADKVLAKL